jgi:beta-lactamase class C
MRLFFLYCIFNWLLVNSVFAKTPTNFLQDFEKIADKAIRDWGIPGLAFAIVIPEDQGKSLIKTYGVKKVGSQEPIDPHTIFRIGSLSKGFSTALAAKLAHREIINLEHKIINYLPEIIISDPIFTQGIKIKHILSHTTGVMQFCMEHEAYKRHSMHLLIKHLKYAKQIGTSGKIFQYQNIIFSLIASIIKKATGQDYVKVIRNEIFSPLEMRNTVVTEEEYGGLKNIAYPHQYQSEKGTYRVIQSSSYYYNILSAGGIASSISDMSKWLSALLGNNPKTLSENELSTLFSPIVAVSMNTKRIKKPLWRSNRLLSMHYALGWYIYDYMGNTVVYHGGKVAGFNSLIAFSPTYKIGIVILANSTSVLPSLLMAHFFDIVFDLKSVNWIEIALSSRRKTKANNKK